MTQRQRQRTIVRRTGGRKRSRAKISSKAVLAFAAFLLVPALCLLLVELAR
ncbi:MAG TPA: hypothetical protein VHL34_08230 [Rhizomicrobium sp.]|jgi:hypothetical protein|nr:hypothetical protein [Rhizomicrobium sp.]